MDIMLVTNMLTVTTGGHRRPDLRGADRNNGHVHRECPCVLAVSLALEVSITACCMHVRACVWARGWERACARAYVCVLASACKAYVLKSRRKRV